MIDHGASLCPRLFTCRVILSFSNTLRLYLSLTDLDIDESTNGEGRVTLAGFNDASLAAAKARVEAMAGDASPRTARKLRS